MVKLSVHLIRCLLNWRYFSYSINEIEYSLAKVFTMKTMNCKQLGGACDKKFSANTFEEMSELSKQHGMEMHKAQVAAQFEAMQEMQALMKNPDDMESWFESKMQEFESLAED